MGVYIKNSIIFFKKVRVFYSRFKNSINKDDDDMMAITSALKWKQWTKHVQNIAWWNDGHHYYRLLKFKKKFVTFMSTVCNKNKLQNMADTFDMALPLFLKIFHWTE